MRERIEALVPELRGLGRHVPRLLRPAAPQLRAARRHRPRFTIYDQADRLRAIKDVMEQLGWRRAGHARTGRRGHQPGQERPGQSRGPASSGPATTQAARRPGLRGLRGEAPRARRPSTSTTCWSTSSRSSRTTRTSAPSLDRRFRYVLVDEYQDTNLAQYAIVRALSVDHPNLCVTGDPDQSIYGWRGANLSNILEFEKDYPGCRVVKLEQNYRSTKNILRVADHLIRFNRKRKPKALLTENPRRRAGRADHLRARDRRGRGRRRQDRRAGRARGIPLRRHRRLLPGDRADRGRSSRPSGRRRSPTRSWAACSFYERQEVKDVLAYLNLMANPKDDLAFARVVNVPPRGLGKTSLEHLVAAARQRGMPLLAMARRGPAGRGPEGQGRPRPGATSRG